MEKRGLVFRRFRKNEGSFFRGFGKTEARFSEILEKLGRVFPEFRKNGGAFFRVRVKDASAALLVAFGTSIAKA